jgi:DUF3040 family protein
VDPGEETFRPARTSFLQAGFTSAFRRISFNHTVSALAVALWRPFRRRSPVPLSEHEQRLLEQMERALYAEDPKFASSLRGKDPRSSLRRRVFLASVGFALGVVLLMTGLVAKMVPVSVIGFVAMLASAFFALTSYRRVTSGARLGVVDGGAVRGSRPTARKVRDHRKFMDRLEDRWNRRRDQNGR